MDDQLKPGDHVCLLYDTMDDQLSAIARYAGTGFGNHQQVVYLANADHSFDVITEMLHRKGIAVADALTSGRLRMIPAQVCGVLADGYAMGLCCYPDLGDMPQKVGTAHPGTVHGPTYARDVESTWTPQLRLRITRNPLRLCVTGEVDLSNRDCLPPALHRLLHLSDLTEPLRIDFSAVTFADVATLRLLIRAAREWPRGLTLIGCAGPIAQTLRLLDDGDGRTTFTDSIPGSVAP